MPTFNKKEKLCSIVEINSLFKNGKGFISYPLSARFIIRESLTPKVLVILSSPKRYHKLAVERNKIKRLLREAYRLNKEEIISFAQNKKVEILLSISFISKDMCDFQSIDSKMTSILSRIISKEHKRNSDENNS